MNCSPSSAKNLVLWACLYLVSYAAIIDGALRTRRIIDVEPVEPIEPVVPVEQVKSARPIKSILSPNFNPFIPIKEVQASQEIQAAQIYKGITEIHVTDG